MPETPPTSTPPPIWILDMYACRAVLRSRPPAGNLLSTAISFACIACAIFVSCATKSDGCRLPLTSVYLFVYAECVQYRKQYHVCFLSIRQWQDISHMVDTQQTNNRARNEACTHY